MWNIYKDARGFSGPPKFAVKWPGGPGHGRGAVPPRRRGGDTRLRASERLGEKCKMKRFWASDYRLDSSLFKRQCATFSLVFFQSLLPNTFVPEESLREDLARLRSQLLGLVEQVLKGVGESMRLPRRAWNLCCLPPAAAEAAEFSDFLNREPVQAVPCGPPSWLLGMECRQSLMFLSAESCSVCQISRSCFATLRFPKVRGGEARGR